VAASRYWELRVPAPADISEALTNFAWELGALGVVEELAGDEGPRLRAFFPDTPTVADLGARVDGYLESLRALGFDAPRSREVLTLAEAPWADAWREHFRPLTVGRGLAVAPPWDAGPIGGRLVIVIDPGRAFGTGHHGSTAGALAALEDVVARERPAHAIDVGTGSGILAIAAARLGVGRVLAIDTDPDAIAAARSNAARNGTEASVQATVADVQTLEAAPSRLVLANLLTAAHLALGPRYAALLQAGGVLVVGGILDAEADRVIAALASHGFSTERARSVDGWTTLELRRPASPRAPLQHPS
jgi:ribosomal protein L11 methyltransferase